MATIKKTIQNLKPGKQYLLTVKPKDADVNTTLDPTSAIRFVVPKDATQPQQLGDLVIVGNYKSIMISFNPSNEPDLKEYFYEVYLPESIGQSGSQYVVLSDAQPLISRIFCIKRYCIRRSAELNEPNCSRSKYWRFNRTNYRKTLLW